MVLEGCFFFCKFFCQTKDLKDKINKLMIKDKTKRLKTRGVASGSLPSVKGETKQISHVTGDL